MRAITTTSSCEAFAPADDRRPSTCWAMVQDFVPTSVSVSCWSWRHLEAACQRACLSYHSCAHTEGATSHATPPVTRCVSLQVHTTFLFHSGCAVRIRCSTTLLPAWARCRQEVGGARGVCKGRNELAYCSNAQPGCGALSNGGGTRRMVIERVGDSAYWAHSKLLD